MYTIAQIAEVINGSATLTEPGAAIEHLLTDSRRLVTPAATLFFAIKTSRRSGAAFVQELYDAGVRNFVLQENINVSFYPHANFVYVQDALQALQTLAAHHRKRFQYQVIGITGSNGKTVVKEWLYQLLQPDFATVRSPKSYNSQVGVPLSVWQMNDHYQLGIFEAGISQRYEMEALQNIILPTIGILTNIGEAHDAGFANRKEKLLEKLLLFKQCELVIFSADDELIADEMKQQHSGKSFSWGFKGEDLRLTLLEKQETRTKILATFRDRQVEIEIPFTDHASIENAITCWCVLLHLGISSDVIDRRMHLLQPVEMRLQLKRAINDCAVINDSYSNDLDSLNIALDFLQQQSGKQSSTVILSDLGEATNAPQQYSKVAAALLRHRIQRFIGIGKHLFEHQSLFHLLPAGFFYKTVDEFIQQYPLSRFRNELILLKGARVFEFERIGMLFEQQVHQTVMEVNLSAMVANLKAYHQCLQPTTKVMAMVKAFSYGSGSAEVASVLQFHKVDYLAVAYADEGVELRKAGIHMPIMVMNPDELTFPLLLQYNLEPELYSFGLLRAFAHYIRQEGIEQVGVHLKLDTGMHRLGFEAADINSLVEDLNGNRQMVVKSVFTHLVASEDPAHDPFTNYQAARFDEWSTAIEAGIGYSFIRHASNSAAIFRHPSLQYDMVRLGIGLYGIDSTAENILQLQPVATLRTTIAQIRNVTAGDSVGYNRRGIIKRDSRIATIRIGYADGFKRSLGNGIGQVWVNGKLAPVVGSVCMDMTMIDISDLPGVTEGDVVEIFGSHLPVQQVATWCNTIPYEILTSISQRVKRVYFQE